jgi:hypothetical protein
MVILWYSLTSSCHMLAAMTHDPDNHSNHVVPTTYINYYRVCEGLILHYIDKMTTRTRGTSNVST